MRKSLLDAENRARKREIEFIATFRPFQFLYVVVEKLNIDLPTP